MGGGILFASGFLAYRYLSFFFFPFPFVWFGRIRMVGNFFLGDIVIYYWSIMN